MPDSLYQLLTLQDIEEETGKKAGPPSWVSYLRMARSTLNSVHRLPNFLFSCKHPSAFLIARLSCRRRQRGANEGAGSLLCGCGVENTPRWVGTLGSTQNEVTRHWVTLNFLCVMRRYYLGVGVLYCCSTPWFRENSQAVGV